MPTSTHKPVLAQVQTISSSDNFSISLDFVLTVSLERVQIALKQNVSRYALDSAAFVFNFMVGV